MATAARKIETVQPLPVTQNANGQVVPLEENGVVRSTVFPNRLRDLRREKGFESLTEFHSKLPDVTYSRLAKIERGQIFPRPDELLSIADKLGCEAEDLLIDVTDASFDREAWAKENVEASLAFRGGAMQDMRIGAALRLRRHELERSTTDMKDFGLPAATVSRIENADRPFKRWTPDIVKGVKKVFGVNSMVKLMEKVDAYEAKGELGPMMKDLFSTGSLRARQAGPFAQLAAAIPGDKGKMIARSMEIDALSATGKLSPIREAVSKTANIPVFEGVSLSDGSMVLRPTEDSVRRKAGAQAVAIRSDRKILGPLDPRSVMIFEKIDRDDVEENMVLAVLRNRSVTIGAVHKMGRGFRLVQPDSENSICLSAIEGDIAKMVQVSYPN